MKPGGSSFPDHLVRSHYAREVQNDRRKRFKMGRLLGRFGPGDGRKLIAPVV